MSRRQEEIFDKSITFNTGGCKTRCLSPQDQFLYLGLHALKHNFQRLIWLVDLKHVVANWRTSDWKALVVRSEVLGHKATLFGILGLMKQLFHLDLPLELSSELESRKPSLLEQRMLRRRVSGRSIPTWAQLILISSGRSLWERLAFFMETLFPRPDVLRQVFATASQSGIGRLYFRRAMQILGIMKIP